MHFKLYEGYVKETNRLTEAIAEIYNSEPLEGALKVRSPLFRRRGRRHDRD